MRKASIENAEQFMLHWVGQAPVQHREELENVMRCLELLRMAAWRVLIANNEGEPILSAWVEQIEGYGINADEEEER